jgi:hypothetical protein
MTMAASAVSFEYAAFEKAANSGVLCGMKLVLQFGFFCVAGMGVPLSGKPLR